MQTPQSHFVNCRFVCANESAINEVRSCVTKEALRSEFMRYEGGLICVEILEAPAALCGARRLRPRDVRRDIVFDIKRCAHSYVARAWASRYSRRTCACALRRGKLKRPPFRVSVKFIYHTRERVRKRVHACETRMIHAICIEHVVVCRAHVRYRTPQEGTTDRVNARVHTKHERRTTRSAR